MSALLRPVLLWIADFDPARGMTHGAALRYFSLSRELQQQGISVHFCLFVESAFEAAQTWLAEQKNAGVMGGFTVLPASPVAQKQDLESAVQPVINQVRPDAVIVSASRILFHDIHLKYGARVIGDFADSQGLYYWRYCRACFAGHRFREAARSLYYSLQYFALERRAIRRYDVGWFVSKVDEASVSFANACETVCIPNGVRQSLAAGMPKVPGQIVFSGIMNFEPNLTAALWFLDEVFPLVLARHPETVFIAAGVDPPPALLSRKSPNVQVPGFVSDLDALLASSALFVSPLISGGGFKNKIAEAIASGTFVIGTALSSEFLEPELRNLIPVGNSPAALADALNHFLDSPQRYDEALLTLRRLVAERYSWSGRARELAGILFDGSATETSQ